MSSEIITRAVLPSRRQGRRRDRRGRGLRGPLLPATVPGVRSRSERFDDVLLAALAVLERRLDRALDRVEFAVEDVPPSAPAPWESGGVALGRYFPADPVAGLTDRIVLYRRPIESRCEDTADLPVLIREVLVEQIAHLTGLEPDQIDPDA